MKMLDKFDEYLRGERELSSATVTAYVSDVSEFAEFLSSGKRKALEGAGNADIVSFLMQLKEDGKSASTVNRKLASLRAFFRYLLEIGRTKEDPTANLKSPRIPRKPIEFLTLEEVELLMKQPDESPMGIRDRALLELMYASGIRAGEVAAANLEDLNLRIGFITCAGEGPKARIIPVGRPARAVLETYVYEARPALIRDKEDDGALFLNYAGNRISRQGVWKILKEYGEKVGLSQKISPQILRNSFAAHMVQNGADLKSIQALLGHEDIAATQVFFSVSKSRIMDVYDKTHPRA